MGGAVRGPSISYMPSLRQDSPSRDQKSRGKSPRHRSMTFHDLTPMMRQYHELKTRLPGTLLLFRLGDFYELFYEDAEIAARELEIVLTSREVGKGRRIPMCGVPYHAVMGHAARLVERGPRVALCDRVTARPGPPGVVPPTPYCRHARPAGDRVPLLPLRGS